MQLTLRKDHIAIDGQDTLTLSRNRIGISVNQDPNATFTYSVTGFTIWCLLGKTRIGRFLNCMRIVWNFCK